MVDQRTSIADFGLFNPFYAGATVTAYTVDSAGAKTSVLATLYEDLTSAETLQNPQTLNSEGRWAFPPYVDEPVILSITGMNNAPDHDTGVVAANLLGTAVAQAQTSATQALAFSEIARRYALSSKEHALILADGSTTPRSNEERWGETLNVKDFDAKGDGVTDDTAAIQAAHDELPSTGGKIRLPAGIYLASSALSITNPCEFFGDGMGITIIRSNANAGHVISVTATPASVYLHDFTIDRSASVVKASGTAGIFIDEGGAGGSLNAKAVRGVRMINMNNGIWVADCKDLQLLDNRIFDFLNVGILLDTVDSTDHGWGRGLVQGNFLWDIGGSAGAAAGIRWSGGSGMRLHANRCLGAFDYGLEVLFNKEVTDHGALFVTENLFELQQLAGIRVSRSAGAATAGTEISHVIISENHIQALTAGYQNPIQVQGSSPGGWIRALQIINNVIQNSRSDLTSDAVILVNDGINTLVQGNTIDHTGSGDGGIVSAGFSSGTQILSNIFEGGTQARRYPSINSTATIRDAGLDTGPTRVLNIPLNGTALASLGTDAVHVAGTTYFAEIELKHFKRVTGIGVLNGTTVGTDNLNVAIYPGTGGAALATSTLAGTTSAGADVFQQIPFTAIIPLPPGRYFIAVQCNGTTAATQRLAAGTLYNLVSTTSATGTFGTFPSLTAPTTFTANVGPIAYLY